MYFILFLLYSCKKLLLFDCSFICINKLKNQCLEFIYISVFLQTLDTYQNKIKMS